MEKIFWGVKITYQFTLELDFKFYPHINLPHITLLAHNFYSPDAHFFFKGSYILLHDFCFDIM